jgi:hypothetical protein
MAQDLPEVCAFARHRFRTGLAEANAMSLASSIYEELIAVFLHDEVVAGKRAPAEAAIDGQTRVLIGSAEKRSPLCA